MTWTYDLFTGVILSVWRVNDTEVLFKLVMQAKPNLLISLPLFLSGAEELQRLACTCYSYRIHRLMWTGKEFLWFDYWEQLKIIPPISFASNLSAFPFKSEHSPPVSSPPSQWWACTCHFCALEAGFCLPGRWTLLRSSLGSDWASFQTHGFPQPFPLSCRPNPSLFIFAPLQPHRVTVHASSRPGSCLQCWRQSQEVMACGGRETWGAGVL